MPVALAAALSLGRLSGSATMIAVWAACLAICDDAGVITDARKRISELTGLDRTDVALTLVELSEPLNGEPPLIGNTTARETLRIIGPERFLRPANPSTEARREALRESQRRWRQSTKASTVTSDAIEIYQIYPRKCGRAAAVLAIERAISKVGKERLVEAVTAFAQAVQRWPEESRKYVPHPATWFNQERWDDDRSEWDRTDTASARDRMNALREMIAEHPANTESRNYDPNTVTRCQIEELRELLRKYREIRNSIAAASQEPLFAT